MSLSRTGPAQGRPAAFDICVTSPLTLSEAGVCAGAAAQAGELGTLVENPADTLTAIDQDHGQDGAVPLQLNLHVAFKLVGEKIIIHCWEE
ncbi:hypothetical protein EMCRGX_G008215 [Ephydatia muelleri]